MQKLNKVMSTRDVIAQLHDGMTIGIGGWAARRKPMALVREIARSQLKDLTVVSYGGPDVGLLCAAGKLKRLIFGFVTLDMLPLDAHFRSARQRERDSLYRNCRAGCESVFGKAAKPCVRPDRRIIASSRNYCRTPTFCPGGVVICR